MIGACAGCQEPPGWRNVPIQGFTPVKGYQEFSLTDDQGPATVRPPWGGSTVIYDGEVILPQFTNAGWTHVGDPDSYDGYVVFPYQSDNAAQGKMYNVVTPWGQSYDYTHALIPGEESNNSFSTISPDGQWMVSGEWDTESRLLVFPMPILNKSMPAGNLPYPLASQINLNVPVTDVQGCDFINPVRLVCSSDDATKELLNVALSAPVGSNDVTGTVTSLGALPLISSCTGTFEAEGVDFDPVTGLLVEVIAIPASSRFRFTSTTSIPEPYRAGEAPSVRRLGAPIWSRSTGQARSLGAAIGGVLGHDFSSTATVILL